MRQRKRNIISYTVPAVGELFMTYLYNVVDGIFVGQGIGAAGLGAVNIGVPFITTVVAIAAAFPMGGATVVAIRKGRGDKEGADKAFSASLIMTIAVSVLLTLIGMIFTESIVDISGGSELSNEMRKMSIDYLFYYSAFSIPLLLSTSLSVFVRNDGSPALSFIGMGIGAVANIFLDWLFIFPLRKGITGAAIASGLGQIAAVFVLLLHFIRKKGELRFTTNGFTASLMGKICKRGIPESVTQLNTPVTALCYNIMLSRIVGDIGVSTFSILSFIFSLANAVLSGVAHGLQPLWGNSYGRKDKEELSSIFRSGLIINLILSVLIVVLLLVFDNPVIRLFNNEENLVAAASDALPFFSLSFIPMSLNLIITSYMFSTKRTAQADAIAAFRGIVVKALAICIIPMFFAGNSIWFAPFAAEAITLIIAIILEGRYKSRP